MRLAILAAKESVYRDAAVGLARTVRDRFPDVPLRAELGVPPPDVLILVGDDRFVLDTLGRVPSSSGIFVVGDGFLSEVPPAGAEGGLRKVLAGGHWIEERLRLSVSVGGRALPPALNEVALLTSRGGGFLRYSLEIDGERVWRDGGDGVVVATPTGSTGYGLSAGGPVMMENAETVVVVPVCSSTGQRPLVVPRQSVIGISEIESRLSCDLVLDGRERVRAKGAGFTVRSSGHPARFVRLGKARYLQVFGKLRAKQTGRGVPAEAPPSAKFLFRLLEDEGPLTERQLIAESGLPERTVRNALRYMAAANLVRRTRSLRDAREAIFSLP